MGLEGSVKAATALRVSTASTELCPPDAIAASTCWRVCAS